MNKAGLTYGNTLTLDQDYDNQYRITSIVVDSIVNLTYGHDANGNVNSILDLINPPGGQPGENLGTYSYQTGTNKLNHFEGIPSIDYGYDSNGNIITEDGWTYIYDLSNQLIRVLEGENQVAEYTFNGAGQRMKKVTQTETRIFHYDSFGHIIAETNQTGQMLAEYVYLGDQLLAMIKPGELAYYYHNDHLGTPQVLTDASGSIVWKGKYSAFGEAATSIATVENPFRFPGQYYDQETGLHYNYYRYYNPPIGRYLTPDPIGLESEINLFVYAANNPLNFFDSFGLYAPVPRPEPPSRPSPYEPPYPTWGPRKQIPINPPMPLPIPGALMKGCECPVPEGEKIIGVSVSGLKCYCQYKDCEGKMFEREGRPVIQLPGK